MLDVPSMEGLGLRRMTHGFDVVPVWTDNERAVVIGVVDLAHARRAVVFGACLQRSSVEPANLLATFGGEGDMHGLLRRLPDPEPELRPAASAEARPSLHFHHHFDT